MGRIIRLGGGGSRIIRPRGLSHNTVQPSGSFTPNLPGGLTFYTDDQFAGIEAWVPPDYGAEGIGGFYAPGGLTYYTSGGATPVTGVETPDGTTGIDFPYPGETIRNGAGPDGFLTTFRTWREYYVAMRVYVPANYRVHYNSEKWIYVYFNRDGTYEGRGSAVLDINPYAAGPEGATFGYVFVLQSGSNATYGTFEGGALATKGQWNLFEFHMRINTVGESDGFAHAWINGDLSMTQTGINFVDGDDSPDGGTIQSYINGADVDGTAGGGPDDGETPVGGQYRRYSRIAVYGSNT